MSEGQCRPEDTKAHTGLRMSIAATASACMVMGVRSEVVVDLVKSTTVNFFFLNDTPPPEIYPLPLPDALPFLAAQAEEHALAQAEHAAIAPDHDQADGDEGIGQVLADQVEAEDVQPQGQHHRQQDGEQHQAEIGRAHV